MTKKSKKEKRRNPNQSHTHTPQGRERERGGELTSTINTKGKERKKEQKGKKKGDYHSQKSQNFHLPPQLRLVFCFLFCFFVCCLIRISKKEANLFYATRLISNCWGVVVLPSHHSIYLSIPQSLLIQKTEKQIQVLIRKSKKKRGARQWIIAWSSVCFAFCQPFFFVFVFVCPHSCLVMSLGPSDDLRLLIICESSCRGAFHLSSAPLGHPLERDFIRIFFLFF